ncbi:putative membrane-anchored protein [Hasllibacter halocynthiae]|uniref:Putative membrane-anchored protein n=1 Tax=Hasllibacter halocynthiae TaxID=595589 RepID=A0A2T0X9E6_9RHOB|nr:DUF3422 domain-containing protein [Hasllibacter halocynthiae]PRY95535.1 putative membrane-anchored protein [Hasllibacter halocynthiae]
MDGTATAGLRDHELRYALANELHARPFPALSAPCHAAYLAIKRPEDAAGRDRDADFAHLLALLDRFGAPHPPPGATHWFGRLGRHELKWEAHTEFVTYTLMGDGVSERPFDGTLFSSFPADWLAQAPGVRMTSALIRVEMHPGDDAIRARLGKWFVGESLAVSDVLDGSATIAGDFRIDAAGHMRFAVWVHDHAGERRIGRIVQRLCEIETYKAMSMLGLARVRSVGRELARLDAALSTLMGDCTGDIEDPEGTLRGLLTTSAELEALLASSSFRFGASRAYEAIVNQRIEVLREERFGGRQTFGEFMMRRFDPAMRTVKATQRRMEAMAERAMRVSGLLRTRVDVMRSAQNQELLASMDQRADAQLQLQKAVEGLSLVAISYYAVNLVVYLLAPFAEAAGGVPRYWFTAATVPVVAVTVWWIVRRVRRRV